MQKIKFSSILKFSAVTAVFLLILFLPLSFDFSVLGNNKDNNSSNSTGFIGLNKALATHGTYTYNGPYHLGTCPAPLDDPAVPCIFVSAWAHNGIAEFTIMAEINWFHDDNGNGQFDPDPDAGGEQVNACPKMTYTGSPFGPFSASSWSGELGCDDFQVRAVSGSGNGGTSVLAAAGDLDTKRPYHDPGYITWRVPYTGEPNQICYTISYSSDSFTFSGSITPCLTRAAQPGVASFSISSNDPTKSWTVSGEYDTQSGFGETGPTIITVDDNGSTYTLSPEIPPIPAISCTLTNSSGLNSSCGPSVTLFQGYHVHWDLIYPVEGRIEVFVDGLPSGALGSWTIDSFNEAYTDSGPNGGPHVTLTAPDGPGGSETYTVTANPAGGCSPPPPIDVTLNSSNNYTDSVTLDYNCSGGGVEICNNGIDDDGDGLTDGADPDCGGSANYNLQVIVTGSGSGTVSSQPGGINCPGDCIQSYTAGSIVTLIPQVLSGTFVGWSGACTGTGNCTLVMDSNKSVTATFNSSSTPPSAPTNLTATPGCSGANPRIVLEWDPSTGDVAYYRIVRTNPDSSSSQYVTSGPVTTFTDTTLVVGEQYRYVVAAISSSGGQSSASNFAFATAPNCSLPPGTPGNAPGVSVVCVGVPPASPQINVSWSEVAGATGYRVYRSDNFSVPLKDVGSATNYTDTGADRPLNYGSSYSYRYVAYNSNGASGQSPSSPSRTATCDATINVSANTSGGSWTISPQNLNGSGLSSSHTVRPSSSGSNYVLNVNPPTGYSVQVSNSDGGSSSVNIRPGQTKSFTITFTNNTPPTPSGAPNAQVSCVPNNPPASPRVTISWNSVSGATGYRLYRNPPFSGGPSIDKSNSLSHTDTDLTYGTTYTYRYTAYNAGGESGQSPASSAVVAICNATITVNVNPPVSGGSWTITPQASPTNGSGVSTAHIVRPGSGGSNFSLTNIVPPSGYTVSSVTNSFGGGNTMTIWPGDSESFTINLQQLLTPPGISASTNNQCERAFITIVDNSSNETGFELYRDYDANFGNGSPGETLLQTIPSSSFVNGQYTYQDIPNIGTVYYHVRAVRSSPPPPIFSNPATTSVNIVDCPPQLDASINVVQVTRGSQVLPPGTRLNNGDTVTFEITVTNLDDSADAFDIATDSTVTSNLTNFSGFALSQDGGNTYNLVNGTLSGTRLLIPGNGSLGDMGPQTVWKLRFNATISSSRVNSAFDRINISGIVTSSNAFSDTYDLGYMLVYLQSSDPTQFREVAP